MDSEVAPVINGYWERAEFPHVLVPKLAGISPDSTFRAMAAQASIT